MVLRCEVVAKSARRSYKFTYKMNNDNEKLTSVQALYEKFVVPTYGRFPLLLERGEGSRVWDVDGHEYLDLGAGIAVCAVGHSHPAVREAMVMQASKLMHTSNLYYTEGQGRLAKRLVECVSVPGKVFFCNSGAEANEGLFKLARRFGSNKGGDHHEIITFSGSFHGRTLAGIAATGQDKVKVGFGPMVHGFRTVPWGDFRAVQEATTQHTVAILIEPIQGEGGIHMATPEFLRQLREHCDRHALLLLFDEVQCGLGRTGDWCGWRSLGAEEVVPDGISWAKGIAGGFPLGAFWVRCLGAPQLEGIPLCDMLGPGSHGTTFGGNPLACAVAHAVLDIIERDGLLVQAATLGEMTVDALRHLESPLIRDVRGVGLMIGIQLDEHYEAVAKLPAGRTPAQDFSLRLIEAGLLVIPAGSHVIRLLPPLNIALEEIERAISIIGQTFKSIHN